MTNNVKALYGEGAIRGAEPAELVLMMYDMLAADLRRAIDALQTRDVERRTNELIHAQSVLEQLQGALNLEAGGEFAQSLDRLFFAIRTKLLEAQWKESVEILREQLDAVETVRTAWAEALSAVTPREPIENVHPAVMATANESTGSDWRA
jgi:flagellar protein FliS